MAVEITPIASELIITVSGDAGRTKNCRFKDLKVSAPNEDVYSVGETLAELQNNLVVSYQRKNTVEMYSV